MKRKHGFTLVELLFVVMILAVLASIVVPRVTQSADNAKKAKCQSNIANLIRAIEMYAAQNDGIYPTADNFSSAVLNSTNYFPHGAPVCPYETDYAYNATNKTITPHNHN